MTRDQFITAVRSEQEGLRRFLLALCGGDASRADDIAQDALVKAYVASERYVPRVKFSSWIHTIAYNCFIDSIRKRSLPTVDAGSAQALDAASDTVADAAFRYQELYAAIETLSPKERAAILLFYMEDRPVKEIADILGVPQGTVKSYLSRGREHLRKIIGR